MTLPKQAQMDQTFIDEYDKAISTANSHGLTQEFMGVVAVKTNGIQNGDLVAACECVFFLLREISTLDETDCLPTFSYEGAASQQRTKAGRDRKRNDLIQEFRNLLAQTTLVPTESKNARNARYKARIRDLTNEGKTIRAASAIVHKEETSAGRNPPDAATIKRCYYIPD